MDTWRLVAFIILMGAVVGAELYFNHEVLAVLGKLLDRHGG